MRTQGFIFELVPKLSYWISQPIQVHSSANSMLSFPLLFLHEQGSVELARSQHVLWKEEEEVSSEFSSPEARLQSNRTPTNAIRQLGLSFDVFEKLIHQKCTIWIFHHRSYRKESEWNKQAIGRRYRFIARGGNSSLAHVLTVCVFLASKRCPRAVCRNRSAKGRPTAGGTLTDRG